MAPGAAVSVAPEPARLCARSLGAMSPPRAKPVHNGRMKTALRNLSAVMPPVAALAMIVAAYLGDLAYVVTFGVFYLAMSIYRAAAQISDTVIATGIATGPRHLGDVRGRVWAAMPR